MPRVGSKWGCPRKLHWIVGTDAAAVRSAQGRVFRLWPKPSEGRVPIGLQMALARPDDELYSDPSATRALVTTRLPVCPIRSALAWAAIALMSAATGARLFLAFDPSVDLVGPSQQITGVLDLIGAIAGLALGYGAAALWEARLCSARLANGQACFGLGSLVA